MLNDDDIRNIEELVKENNLLAGKLINIYNDPIKTAKEFADERIKETRARNKKAKLLIVTVTLIVIVAALILVPSLRNKARYSAELTKIEISDFKPVAATEYEITFSFPMTVTNNGKLPVNSVVGELQLMDSNSTQLMTTELRYISMNLQPGCSINDEFSVVAPINENTRKLVELGYDNLNMNFKITTISYKNGDGIITKEYDDIIQIKTVAENT